MIDLVQARELLARALETQGRDFTYTINGLGCFYEKIDDETVDIYGDKVNPTPDDSRRVSGCLIGTALDLAGETRHHGFKYDVRKLAQKYPDMLSAKATDYFRIAQFEQDYGHSWGVAYDRAEQVYGE